MKLSAADIRRYEELALASGGYVGKAPTIPDPVVKGSAPGCWTLTLIGWTPCSDNKLIGYSPRVIAQRKSADVEVIQIELLMTPIPKATRKRRLSVTYIFPPKGRAGDPSNYAKSLFDALVKMQLLVDDSSDWLVADTPVVERGRRATIITLEDLLDDTVSDNRSQPTPPAHHDSSGGGADGA